jgi:hypothetical protein
MPSWCGQGQPFSFTCLRKYKLDYTRYLRSVSKSLVHVVNTREFVSVSPSDSLPSSQRPCFLANDNVTVPKQPFLARVTTESTGR